MERPKVSRKQLISEVLASLTNRAGQLEQLSQEGWNVKKVKEEVWHNIENCIEEQDSERLTDLRRELGTEIKPNRT